MFITFEPLKTAKYKIEVFMAKTFRRGTHPPTHKRYQDFPLNDFKVPDKLYVSLSQHIGAPAKAVVSVGDSVKEGQLIGEAAGFVSANIFAPVSGTVSLHIIIQWNMTTTYNSMYS